MRKFIVASVASLALAAAASPASAEGFRAEIHGGYDVTNADGPGDTDADGFMYGVGFGYDFDIGKAGFIGPDFSIDDSSARECGSSVLLAGDRLCVRAGRDLAAGIRGGVKVSENGKLYALAGYTNARFVSSYTTPAGVRIRDGENLDGFRLGAGYEHSFGGNLYGKAEYRYSNYEAGVDRHQFLMGVGMNF